jgi:hypothetical protein
MKMSLQFIFVLLCRYPEVTAVKQRAETICLITSMFTLGLVSGFGSERQLLSRRWVSFLWIVFNICYCYCCCCIYCYYCFLNFCTCFCGFCDVFVLLMDFASVSFLVLIAQWVLHIVLFKKYLIASI